MPDLRLQEDTHDLYFIDNDLVITTEESDSLRQRLIVKLYTFQEEWYLDTTLGTPWYQQIFGKNRSKETIDSIFKQSILEEPEVLQIESFQSSIDRASRIYSLSFRVRSSNAEESIPVELEL